VQQSERARWSASSGSGSAPRRLRSTSLSMSTERASRTCSTGWRSQAASLRDPAGVLRVDIDYQGRAGGPLRDPVMRDVALTDA
jgi:hypothetical protein